MGFRNLTSLLVILLPPSLNFQLYMIPIRRIKFKLPYRPGITNMYESTHKCIIISSSQKWMARTIIINLFLFEPSVYTCIAFLLYTLKWHPLRIRLFLLTWIETIFFISLYLYFLKRWLVLLAYSFFAANLSLVWVLMIHLIILSFTLTIISIFAKTNCLRVFFVNLPLSSLS